MLGFSMTFIKHVIFVTTVNYLQYMVLSRNDSGAATPEFDSRSK